MLLEVTDYSYENTIGQNGLVVMDFWSPWCRPCNMLTPIIHKLSEANPDVTFGKLNTIENNAATAKLGVSAIPTIVFYKNGVLVKRLLGYHTEAKLQSLIDELK